MHPLPTLIQLFLLTTALLFGSISSAGDDPKPLKIHIIDGGEYDPVPSMTDFKKFLEAQYRVECTTSFYSGTGSPSKLENLDSLKSADLLILFARRMSLREDQMKLIRAHWEQGKPIVGIRTACHAFQKADNDIIDRKLFGGAYGGPSSNGGYQTASATYASILRSEGYATGYVGKWHMDNQAKRPGFDWYASFTGQSTHHGATFLVNGKPEKSEQWTAPPRTHDHAQAPEVP